MRSGRMTPLRGLSINRGSEPLALRMGMVDLIAQATCERASSAHAAQTGIVGVDVLRRWRTPGGIVGLIEGAGTRLNSSDLTQWVESGEPGNTTVSPLGTGAYNVRIVTRFGATGLNTNFTTALAYHSVRMFIRVNEWSGQENNLIVTFRVGSTTEQYGSHLIGAQPIGEWVEVDISATATATNSRLSIVNLDGSGRIADIDVAFVQVEQNPYPTSWIPPEGTARAADTAPVDFTLGDYGAIMFAVRPQWASANRDEAWYLCCDDPRNFDLLCRRNSENSVRFWRGSGSGGNVVIPASLTPDTWSTIALTWEPGILRGYGNGVAGTPSLDAPAYNPVSAMYLGRDHVLSSGEHFDGSIAAFAINGRTPSAAEIAALSNDLLARLTA